MSMSDSNSIMWSHCFNDQLASLVVHEVTRQFHTSHLRTGLLSSHWKDLNSQCL